MKEIIGPEGMLFLRYGLQALERLLPHTKIDLWKVIFSSGKTEAVYKNQTCRELRLSLVIKSDKKSSFTLNSELRRKTSETGGVGDNPRVIDYTEKKLCEKTLQRLASVL